MDNTESNRDKGRYLRVIVEVDVKEELPDKMEVDIYGVDCVLQFEYKWKPQICTLCQRVDHISERCPQKVLQVKPKKKKLVDKWVVKQKGQLGVQDVDKVFEEKDVRDDCDTRNNLFDKKVSSLKGLPSDAQGEIVYVSSDEAVDLEDPARNQNTSKDVLYFSSNSKEISQKINNKEKIIGRLWIGWDPLMFAVTVVNEMDQCLLLKIYILQTGKMMFCTPVYAFNTIAGRRRLWGQLIIQSSIVNGPWLVVGDWNATRFHLDKKGGRMVPQNLFAEFNDYLQYAGLIELFATNGEWTWCNRQGSERRILAKLDRVFTNNAWLQMFTGTKISYSASTSSDHYGVVINIFRQFNKNSFGDIEERVLSFKKTLEEIQLSLLDNPSNELFVRKNHAKEDYNDALSSQQILYAQKSRILWLKDNDRCTAFFYSKMKQHNQFNAITSVETTNGQVTTVSEVIKKTFVDYYQNLF
ncbi:uncharacterized protein LOC132309171 [Cornus florida]|uniref:uncharacterized protein LOC132309171 n=1 Tax=Cornus florida TaxID=4283 RepID=UPI0028998F6A|nr:uncharacterized protein LOC132309171 [Cornus florida]